MSGCPSSFTVAIVAGQVQISGERAMAAEFPTAAQARDVFTAIGHGERTYSNIARAAGGITHASLSRSLEVLKNGSW